MTHFLLFLRLETQNFDRQRVFCGIKVYKIANKMPLFHYLIQAYHLFTHHQPFYLSCASFLSRASHDLLSHSRFTNYSYYSIFHSTEVFFPVSFTFVRLFFFVRFSISKCVFPGKSSQKFHFVCSPSLFDFDVSSLVSDVYVIGRTIVINGFDSDAYDVPYFIAIAAT